jgi:hypothetical protein
MRWGIQLLEGKDKVLEQLLKESLKFTVYTEKDKI